MGGAIQELPDLLCETFHAGPLLLNWRGVVAVDLLFTVVPGKLAAKTA